MRHSDIRNTTNTYGAVVDGRIHQVREKVRSRDSDSV